MKVVGKWRKLDQLVFVQDSKFCDSAMMIEVIRLQERCDWVLTDHIKKTVEDKILSKLLFLPFLSIILLHIFLNPKSISFKFRAFSIGKGVLIGGHTFKYINHPNPFDT